MIRGSWVRVPARSPILSVTYRHIEKNPERSSNPIATTGRRRSLDDPFREIIQTLERWHLIVRQVAELTGITAAEFSRIHDVKLDRYPVERLLTGLGRLSQQAGGR